MEYKKKVFISYMFSGSKIVVKVYVSFEIRRNIKLCHFILRQSSNLQYGWKREGWSTDKDSMLINKMLIRKLFLHNSWMIHGP